MRLNWRRRTNGARWALPATACAVPCAFHAFCVGWIASLALALSVSAAHAQVVEPLPKYADDAGLEEHLDAKLPLDLPFVDETGAPVTLRSYFTDNRPVLLTLNYYSCPMLCTLQLNGLVDGLRNIDWTPGHEFRIVTVSINPKETPELATGKKKTYLEAYGHPDAVDGWHFLVGAQENIEALAGAVGFKYELDPATGQYAHPAVAYVITPDGNISRYLYGVQFEPKTLRYSLVEASAGHIGNTIDRLVLLCFHYDASRGRYAPAAMNIMRLGGGLTALILGGWILAQWTRGRRRTVAAHG